MAKTNDFRLDIQGLRAIAVLLVVLYHVRFSIPHTLEIAGGFVGVDVFFVISGFVVGGALYRELVSSGRLKFGTFLARRAKRLLPALGVLLSVVVVSAVFTVSLEFMESTSLTALASTFFGANVWLWLDASNYFTSTNSQNPLLHTWSLSLEEQFYILLMIAISIIIFLNRGDPSRKRLQVLSLLLAILFTLSFAYSVYEVSVNPTAAFYSPFSRGWQFLLGVLLYVGIKNLKPRWQSRSLALIFWLAGLSFIAYSAVYFSRDTDFPGFSALLPSMGAAFMIFSQSLNPRGFGSRVLEIPPLVALGNLSYSWYLWHWPIIVFADFWWPGNDEIALLAALLSLIPAALSYWFVEAPFRKKVLKSQTQRAYFVLLSFLLPIAMSISGLALNALAFQTLEKNDSFLAKIRIEQKQIVSNLTTLIDATEKVNFVIVGDSHAGSLAGGLSIAAAERGQTVGLITQGRGCLLLEGPFTGIPDENCSKWQKEALELLTQSDIDTVILHGYATGRITGFNRGNPYQFEISDIDGQQATELNQALELYEIGLSTVVATIVRSGKNVIILSTLPDFTRPLPTLGNTKTTVYQVLIGNYPEVSEDDIELIPLSTAQERNKPLLEIERRVASTHEKAVSLDLAPYSCVDRTCQQWREGVLIYSDLDHITGVEALRLSEILLRIIEKNP